MKKYSKNLIRIISFFVTLCFLSTVASAVQIKPTDEMTEAEYEKIFKSLDIPSFINEDNARAAKHVERLSEYEDSYDKIGYKNADGTNTLYMFSSPVKYMDENGELKDADPNITETTDTLKQSGYSHINEFGKLKTYFANSLSNDKGVKIELNDDTFEFGFSINEKKQNLLQKAASAVTSVFSKPQNKAAVLTENRVQKLEHLKVDNQNNVLSLPTIDGAAQTLVLKEAPEDNKIIFWVKTEDATPTVDNSGKNIVFSSEETDFSIGVSDIKDSGGQLSIDNTAKILNTQNGNTLVEVSLDESVINSPDTVYPVSVTLSASATSRDIGSFAPLDVDYSYFQDTTLYTNSVTEVMDAYYLIVGQLDYTSICATAFMKYNTLMLEGIDPRLIYDASLCLVEASGNASSMSVNLARVTSEWYEDNVDPALYYAYDVAYPGNNNIIMKESGTYYTYEIDITHLFTDHMLYEQGFGGGVPNYGFQFYTDPSYEFSKHICSSEYYEMGYRPFISIRYEDPEPLTLGYTTHDYLNPDDPSDWYYFTPSATSFYDIYTSGNTDVYAYLYDSDLALITQDDDSGEYANFKITREFQANKTYYLKVQSRSYSTAGYYYLDVECNFEETFNANNAESSELLTEINLILSEYLQDISPPRYCNGVEITSLNKNETDCQGENIYQFLLDWYSEHIWPYEKQLPQWAGPAEVYEEDTKRSAFDEWSDKVYCGSTWDDIVNGFDNFVDVLYYEVTHVSETLDSAFRQIIGGNYSDEFTITGTAGQIILSISGVDFVTDIRDAFYDVTHWEFTWSHVGQTTIDLISLFPVVGAAKNLDEVALLTKHVDNINDLVKSTAKLDSLFSKIDEFTLLLKNTGKLEDLLNNTQLLVKWASHKGTAYEDIVMLGKWAADATSYDTIAKSNGYSFFALPSKTWDELAAIDTDGTKLWAVNKGFLNNHIANNSTFYFSHNPNFDFDHSGFAKEIQHLRGKGFSISNVKNSEGYWYAYKQ